MSEGENGPLVRATLLNAIVEQTYLAVGRDFRACSAEPSVHELEGLALAPAVTAAQSLEALGPLRPGELAYFIRWMLVNACVAAMSASVVAAGRVLAAAAGPPHPASDPGSTR